MAAANAPTSSRLREALLLHQAGDLTAAEAAYKEILTESPDHAGAWHLLGLINFARRRFPKAREQIERALSSCNTKAVYHSNHAAVLRELGLPQEAQSACERALRIRPDFPDALSNLALCLWDLDEKETAAETFAEALTINPNHPDALRHLARLCADLGHTEKAIAHLQHLISVMPQDADAWNALGRLHSQKKQPVAAANFQRKAAELRPDDPNLQLALGRVLADCGDILEAKRAFDEAGRLATTRPAWRYRYLGYLPHVFEDEAAIDRSLDELNRGLDEAAAAHFSFEWRRALEDGFCPPFGITHLGRCCRELKQRFSALFRSHFPQQRPPARRKDRLRIGFLATSGRERGFLRDMKHIILGLNREQFEPVVLCPDRGLKICQDAMSAEHVRWLPFPEDFERSVAAISSAECDILYHRQIGTDVSNYFLAFARCAPIQCTGWGTHGTTGIAEVDYYISSDLIELEGAESRYTEQLFLLRGTLPTCQTRIKRPRDARRSEFGLPERGAIYFCPQRIEKIHPNFDGLLRGILDADGDGAIVMLKGRYPTSFERLVRRFRATLGPTLLKRVIFFPSLPANRYYRLFSLADVVLDTPNYSASLTGFDAVSLGVPIVTLPGIRKVERYAYAIYRKLGLMDLVADTEEQYVAAATQLGRDRVYLRHMRERIEARSSRLFDDASAIREHERFFKEVHTQ